MGRYCTNLRESHLLEPWVSCFLLFSILLKGGGGGEMANGIIFRMLSRDLHSFKSPNRLSISQGELNVRSRFLNLIYKLINTNCLLLPDHHIHHLNARIPGYRLRECHEA